MCGRSLPAIFRRFTDSEPEMKQMERIRGCFGSDSRTFRGVINSEMKQNDPQIPL